jgi:tetratricopeptide (TPR) repeat protein
MLIGYLPAANLLPLMNPMAERYVYLSTAGFALLLARVLIQVRRTKPLPTKPQISVTIVTLICGLLVGVYLGISGLRLRHWRDDARLWNRTLRDEPRSTRALVWTGLDLKRQGRRAEARARFVRANELNPQDTLALINLAVLEGEDGKLVRAEELLREAIRRRPDIAEAHWNLFFDLQLQNRPDEALIALRETLRLNPWHLPARQAMLDYLADQGPADAARAFAGETLRMDPGNEHALRVQHALTFGLTP